MRSILEATVKDDFGNRLIGMFKEVLTIAESLFFEPPTGCCAKCFFEIAFKCGQAASGKSCIFFEGHWVIKIILHQF